MNSDLEPAARACDSSEPRDEEPVPFQRGSGDPFEVVDRHHASAPVPDERLVRIVEAQAQIIDLRPGTSRAAAFFEKKREFRVEQQPSFFFQSDLRVDCRLLPKILGEPRR